MRPFLLGLLALGLTAQTPAPQITLSSLPALAPPATQVSIAVSLLNGGGPAAVQWDMTGIPAGATIATAVAGKTLQCTAALSRCVLSGLNATAIVDGVIATIQYAQPATPPTEALANPQGATPGGAASAVMTGAVTSKCDINADGKVDATDVGLIVTQALAASGTAGPSVVDIMRVIIAAFGGACLR